MFEFFLKERKLLCFEIVIRFIVKLRGYLFGNSMFYLINDLLLVNLNNYLNFIEI